MCSKQNRRFKFEYFYYDNSNKWVKNTNKHISCKCKCKLDGGKYNLNQKCNNDKCLPDWKNPKEHNVCEKYYICNPTTYTCENSGYLTSTFNNSVIMCECCK